MSAEEKSITCESIQKEPALEKFGNTSFSNFLLFCKKMPPPLQLSKKETNQF